MMIELDNVTRTWGNFKLDVTLDVVSGQYVVVLGPSGCGKSLLLGMIAGLYAPVSGEIRLQGEPANTTLPEHRGVGFVFQHLSLFPHLSVADNIGFGLRARGVKRAQRQQRVDELIRLLKIEALVGRAVPTLSGGESQKVAIARALAPRPKILLLDEPLSLVDHNARVELQSELRRLHHELGLTTLHVTHNRDEARAQATTCALMLGGRIVQAGPMDTLISDPACVFVAGFFGDAERPNPRNDCTESCFRENRCDRAVSKFNVTPLETESDQDNR